VRPDRGVVDEDVDAAEFGHCPRHHRVDLIFLGDVGNDGERPDPQVPGFARDVVSLGLVGAGIDDDVSPLPCQLQYRGAADVAARAGY
jgi:hypothetical protein